jgi:hypothetical protein
MTHGGSGQTNEVDGRCWGKEDYGRGGQTGEGSVVICDEVSARAR